MRHEVKPLGCEPGKLKGLSEKLIISHNENNYVNVFMQNID
jgi:superoxide dismutase, Fe-Mn family